MNFNKYGNNYNIIGQNLKKFREKNNISQEVLSNKLSLLGITLYQSDIQKIENNKRFVRDFELWGMCTILGITTENLFAPDIIK